MTDKGFEVVGIDVSEKMVEIAKEENPNSEVKLMDATNLELKSNSFDAIFSFYVLEHLKPESFSQAIDEIKRVIKPGGYFLLVQYDDEYEGFLPDLMTKDKKKLFRYMIPLEKMKELLEEKGFKVEFSERRDFSEETETEDSTGVELAVLSINKKINC